MSLMTRFIVPQCPSKTSRSGYRSHGQPSAQWLPDRSMVMGQVRGQARKSGQQVQAGISKVQSKAQHYHSVG